MSEIAWLAVDWGTSNLRVWAIDTSGQPLDQRQSKAGMATLTPEGFEPALLNAAGDWAEGPTTVVACGMVGARQGWVEAPYTPVPCAPLPAALTPATTSSDSLTVHIVAGLCQTNPADVMRGEETQIAGFLALNPKWDGVICLPGTHTKWAHVSAGEVVSFQTFMTGDLFAALSQHTVLRHSVADTGWDEAAFLTALDDALSRPDRLAARLFSLRAEDLLANLTPETARARLSGALLGAELAAAKPYWLGQQLAVIGAGKVAEVYVQALGTQGAPAILVDNDAATLAGLKAAYASLKGAV